MDLYCDDMLHIPLRKMLPMSLDITVVCYNDNI